MARREVNDRPRRPPAAAGRKMSRRSLLKASATVALLAAAKRLVPGGAHALWRQGPEVTKATKLGYIALTDASPLIIAKEKGFFAKHGLPDMEILKQASWGATRDNMALGTKANGIDGATPARRRCISTPPAR